MHPGSAESSFSESNGFMMNLGPRSVTEPFTPGHLNPTTSLLCVSRCMIWWPPRLLPSLETYITTLTSPLLKHHRQHKQCLSHLTYMLFKTRKVALSWTSIMVCLAWVLPAHHNEFMFISIVKGAPLMGPRFKAGRTYLLSSMHLTSSGS